MATDQHSHPSVETKAPADSPVAADFDDTLRDTAPTPRPKRSTNQRPWFLRTLTLSILACAMILALVWFLYPWSGSSKTELTHTITRGDMNVTVIEKGLLESANNTEIKCKVRGWSTVIQVVEGGTVVKPGDTLVKLDTKRIDDAIGKHSTDAHVATATYERTKADVANAEIAIEAYLEGTYATELNSLEQSLGVAEEDLANAQQSLKDSIALFRKGYVSQNEVDSSRLVVTQAKLEVRIRETAIEVLNKYTKEMRLEALRGNLKRLRSKMKADEAGLAMDAGRRDRAIKELEFCVIKAKRGGLVIYPQAEAWKEAPDIDEGANVRHDQVLLLMPDLSQMQVKVSVHESLVDRVKVGLPTRVTLPEFEVDGSVKEVATIAQPAGWWTGNNVKYDTVIELPEHNGLKPGMSCQVEILIAEYKDVLTIPVSAVVETDRHKLCWVKTPTGVERRLITLGDSNEVFIIVNSGLNEGDKVVLNPLEYVDDAKGEALKTLQETIDENRKTNPADPQDNPGKTSTETASLKTENGNPAREMEATHVQ